MRPPLVALLLAAVLVTSGCLGGPSRPPSDQRAADMLNRSQEALTDVTSYRTTVDGRVEASRNDEQLRLSVTGTVAVNASTQQMNGTARIDGGPEMPGRSERQTTYVTGHTVYAECARLGWERRNLSQSRSWLTYTPVGQQLAALNRTNVYWNGTEPVGGTEAAVVVAYPTESELRAVPGVRSGGRPAVGDASIENATLTVWFDTDTGRPLKARRHIRTSQGDTTATATTTFRFTDYNEPTTVTRPDLDNETFWESECPGSG